MLANLRQKYSGKSIEGFRRSLAYSQTTNAVATAIIELLASISFFLSGITNLTVSEEQIKWLYVLYAPLVTVSLIVLITIPVFKRKGMRYWKVLEAITFLAMTVIPFWAVFSMYLSIDPNNSVNLLLWALSLVAFGTVICSPPFHTVSVFIVSTILLFVLCAHRMTPGEIVNSLILSFACCWGAVMRFYHEFKAFKLGEERDAFLARMSHEIRTPINSVIGTNELIQRECTDPKILDFSGDIKSAGTMLLSIVNDILDLSKLESGSMKIVCDEYSLSKMVHDLETMIHFRAETSGLEFKVSIDEKLPDRLCGDEIRVKQIVMNLLTNAVKYTDEGTVSLRVDGEISDDVMTLAFCVRDTGIGLKSEDISKLQNSFYRVEDKRNHRVEGTGLGLNIVNLLLGQMNGSLSINSVYGSGSEFTAFIPQKIVGSETVMQAGEKSASVDNANGGTSFTAPNASILVADDNIMNLKLFARLLEYTNCHISMAKNGKETLDIVKTKHFDLMFIDHFMPDIDGPEVLRIIHETETPNRDTPTVALTANERNDGYEYYQSFGFIDYLSKPIDVLKLEETVKRYLPVELVEQ